MENYCKRVNGYISWRMGTGVLSNFLQCGLLFGSDIIWWMWFQELFKTNLSSPTPAVFRKVLVKTWRSLHNPSIGLCQVSYFVFVCSVSVGVRLSRTTSVDFVRSLPQYLDCGCDRPGAGVWAAPLWESKYTDALLSNGIFAFDGTFATIWYELEKMEYLMGSVSAALF